MRLKDFIPLFLLNWYHFVWAFLGALIYGFPSKRLKVIGITGTKGKSTTIELTRVILEKAGYKVASASSIKFRIGKKEELNKLKMTMPGRFKLQKFLKKAVRAGCKYAILEVTSEGILQHREKFIDFDIVVFTNLAPEHIERHGSFEKYRKAKAVLFQECKKLHIINTDDKNSKYFLEFPSKQKLCYGINPNLEKESWEFINANNLNLSGNKIEFEINNVQFNLNLSGKFNIYNSLAAISIALSQGVSLETCKKALGKVKKIPGRMEIMLEKPFKVVVDYAHTPDSLEQVYKTLSNGSKLICVLGSCGGGRDKWKRPVLGEIAQKYCQEIIITNEDPYDENPEEIINQVLKGAGSGARKIVDRREAIREALKIAEKEDIVLITGKGSESSICLENGERIPWDDKKVVKEEFIKINKKHG